MKKIYLDNVEVLENYIEHFENMKYEIVRYYFDKKRRKYVVILSKKKKLYK